MQKNLLIIVLLLNINFIKSSFRNKTENNITLETYEAKADNYVNNDSPHIVSGEFKIWIDSTLKLISKNSKIFEIGSGFGRDAKYIKSMGYNNIQTSDAVDSFIKILNKKNLNAFKFNILKDNFKNNYDLIFASSVFLHFNRQELKFILEKIYKNLDTNGILSFSVKEGIGETWSSHKVDGPRYFCYWQPENISKLLKNTGFKVISLKQKITTHPYLYIIAQK